MKEAICDHYKVLSLQPLYRVECWWLSMPDKIKTYRYVMKTCPKSIIKEFGWRHCFRPLNNNFVQVFIQNKTRNQNVRRNKDLFKVKNGTPVQSMKTRTTRTPERHQAALEFQHFLPRQIKCRGNFMKYILPRLFLSNVFTEAGRILY